MLEEQWQSSPRSQKETLFHQIYFLDTSWSWEQKLVSTSSDNSMTSLAISSSGRHQWWRQTPRLISYLLITDAFLRGKPKHKINEESELVVISNLTDNYRYLVKDYLQCIIIAYAIQMMFRWQPYWGLSPTHHLCLCHPDCFLSSISQAFVAVLSFFPLVAHKCLSWALVHRDSRLVTLAFAFKYASFFFLLSDSCFSFFFCSPSSFSFF
jgi:hypothetical protein